MRPTILVVEDEEVVGLFLRESLLDAGFEVHFLCEAKPALRVLEESVVAAAIIDVGLPDLMGDELAGQIRARRPMLPIILTSGFDRSHYEAQFSSDLCLRVLAKPFDVPELLEQLNALMSVPRRQSAEEASSCDALPRLAL